MSFYIRGIVFDELGSDPGSPVEGEIWYNTTEKRYKVYRDGAVRAFNDKAELDAHIATRSNPHEVSLEEARQQYSTLSGTFSMGGYKITDVATPTADGDVATWGKVQDHVTASLNGLDWQNSVLSQQEEDPTSISPSDGDRYIIPSSGTGDWSGKEGQIAEWNGSSWDYIYPNEGFALHVEDEATNYNFPSSGTGWVDMGSVIGHSSLQGLDADDHTQYHTDGRADTWLGTKDTDDLSEGATNLYYTDGRVSANSDVSANSSHRTNTSNPHNTDIGNLGSGTLAELNSIITDATLDDSSSERPPSDHASDHESGGTDVITHDNLSGAGTYTHAQLDSHYTSTANPHQVSLEQARLQDNTVSGTIDMGDNKITSVGDPTVDGDATNKLYADDHVAGYDITGTPEDGYALVYNTSSGTWGYEATTAGSVTGATNVGSSGEGVFKQESSGVLEFKKIDVASNKLTISGTATDEIDIDVVPGNIEHQDLSGAGTNDHSAIDSHISSTANPHSVTATQVGKDTAQWNADELQGETISSTTPLEGQVLTYSGSQWVPQGTQEAGIAGEAKAGKILAAAFSGNPKAGTVSFSTAYGDTDYSISLTSVTTNNANFAPVAENITASGFDIQMGAGNISNLTSVLWMTMPFGE